MQREGPVSEKRILLFSFNRAILRFPDADRPRCSSIRSRKPSSRHPGYQRFDRVGFPGWIPAEKWQRGRMHTPAKGAGLNKGLGGSNPPFSASIPGRQSQNLAVCLFFISTSLLLIKEKMRVSYNGNTLAFQAKAEGSIPFTRSIFKSSDALRSELFSYPDCRP